MSLPPPDRFSTLVKKEFESDYLNSENKLFINKLNKISATYEATQASVSLLNMTVNKDHKLQLEDQMLQIKDQCEDLKFFKSRLEDVENHLPKMIREMVDYYMEIQVKPQLQIYCTKEEFKTEIVQKMDYAIFKDYVKEVINRETADNKEFKTDERLYMLERDISKMVTKDEFKAQLKVKASNERLIELRENVHKLQVLSISNTDKYEIEIKRLDHSILKKALDLQKQIETMDKRVV